MTKAEIVNRVAQSTGMSRKDAITAVEIFLTSIKDGLKHGEKISLVGFGTFYVKHKKARNGRNPRTGDRIQIPPKLIATFKPGKSFRQLINEDDSHDGTISVDEEHDLDLIDDEDDDEDQES